MSEPAGVPRADGWYPVRWNESWVVAWLDGSQDEWWSAGRAIRKPPAEVGERIIMPDERTPDTAPAPERHECNCEYCEARPCSERIATVEVSLKDCQNPECPVGCPDSHAVYLGEDPPEAAKQSEPPVSAQWQPIETAPKDGTKILLGWPGIINMGRGDERGFYAINSANRFQPESPTHWMPLPEPPARAAAAESEEEKG